MSGCRLCGCVNEGGNLAQSGYQVGEFGGGSNSIAAQSGETKVLGVVGGEIRERNATAINLCDRCIAIYGRDFSPGTGRFGVATIFRKVGGNGKVGEGGQGLLVRGRDGTGGAAPATVQRGYLIEPGPELGCLHLLVVEAPQIDRGVFGVAGQIGSERVPPSSAVRRSIADESRGALALQIRLDVAGSSLDERGRDSGVDVYDDLVTDVKSKNIVIFEESIDGAEVEVQKIRRPSGSGAAWG